MEAASGSQDPGLADNNTSTGDPHELHYYFNGIQLGDVSNNGTSDVDYAASIAQQTAATPTNPGPFPAARRPPRAQAGKSATRLAEARATSRGAPRRGTGMPCQPGRRSRCALPCGPACALMRARG